MAGKRVKKFSALVGMISVTTLLMLYFVAVPSFWGTTAGKVFSVIWLVMALVTMFAFGQKVFAGRKKRVLAPVYMFRSPSQAASKLRKGARQKGTAS